MPTKKWGAPATMPSPNFSSKPNDIRLAYSMREVGQMVGMSERSIWMLIQIGKLRAVKLGRSVRIPADALAELLGGAS